ncbi:ABC transporter permease [Rhizobium calliandrae]|uniref:ABC transporter permease n=1 Tax=Rhizobium calliandrae TaxID=1312182 RepID=A0ABT7KGM6_9HYPH|nr:ABC transporter permease [Rhizobium calliandrae]MDL2407773.1 ABC transporter permease [Rhizobium calliandrae]
MLWFRIFLNRLAWFIPTLFALLIFVFILSRSVPIDPAVLIAGENASSAQVTEVRKGYGFHKPLISQFALYLRNLSRGDLGNSLYTHQSISSDLEARLPATVELAASSIIVAILVGIPLGVACGIYYDTLFDHLVRIATVASMAAIPFWLAIQLQLLFSMKLDWLPLSGRFDGFPPTPITGLLTMDTLIAGDREAFFSAAKHLVLPTLTLGLPTAATIQRFTRNSVANFIDSPPIMYQTAMGLPRRIVIWKYLLRMSLSATIALIGPVVGIALIGAVAVEAIFDWPGLGNYAFRSILYSDYNAVMGFTLLSGLIFSFVNLIIDLLQAAVDPRGAL